MVIVTQTPYPERKPNNQITPGREQQATRVHQKSQVTQIRLRGCTGPLTCLDSPAWWWREEDRRRQSLWASSSLWSRSPSVLPPSPGETTDGLFYTHYCMQNACIVQDLLTLKRICAFYCWSHPDLQYSLSPLPLTITLQVRMTYLLYHNPELAFPA